MQESNRLEQRECVLQLAERIGELPPVQKKVLAMYYFENLPLAEIAVHLGLSKIGTCQILVETSARLLAIPRVPLLKMVKKVTTDQEANSISREIQ
jgi:DNA-directed RNA polymerase specialized sigma subunit